jgi:hypothetical protein
MWTVKKYFALDTTTGDLRLRYVGKFDFIGEAIEASDKKFKNSIWILAKDDFQMLVKDFEIGQK